MAPIILPANQPPDRFYKGGAQISSFRGNPPCGAYEPEDWIGSTTCCLGCQSSGLGMTRLSSGEYLKDAIAAEPEKWLGEEHIRTWGVDTKLLVKLLDPQQRLLVHAHPHVSWAKEHLGAKHGKAEAWYFLTPGTVWLGLKEHVPADRLMELVKMQDVETLMDMMHRINVEPHQTVYVPPGMLHAIGQGILLVEVQEPEDYSILLEWKGFQIDGEKDGHLGLGFKTALTAVNNMGYTEEEILQLKTEGVGSGSVLAKTSSEYFVLERRAVEKEERCRRGFTVMVVLSGEMELATASGDKLTVKKGTTAVIPFADGDITLRGKGEVLFARPPLKH